MSIITRKGSEIDFDENVDLKKVFIRLKDNQSVKVRILAIGDYVEYESHSEFSSKIYTQPCIKPLGKTCPLCVASKSGIEPFDKLTPKKRYLFAFADIESKELRVWECSKSQAKNLLSQIEEYKDDIQDIAFNFKRTGTKTETSYKLNPILKMKGDDYDNFHFFDDAKVEMSFFESVLVPRSEQTMMEILDEAGFPMKKYFPDYTKSEDTPDEGDIPF